LTLISANPHQIARKKESFMIANKQETTLSSPAFRNKIRTLQV